tara:strand:- start:870 stop:1178 length:309 start_codon:yes stop_codon:yes gene_type:complete
MSKKAFDKIAAGLNEAIEIARGERKPERMFIPPEIDVRAIRRKAKMTQDGFANSYGFTVNQIRDWEQGRARPLGGVRAYLLLIDRAPEDVCKMLAGLGRKAA